MSLEDLDRLLAMRTDDEALRISLSQPVDLDTLKQLAAERGLSINDEDILAAQHRADQARSAAELQAQQGDDARRLRNFVNG
jgi:hypothetical protein